MAKKRALRPATEAAHEQSAREALPELARVSRDGRAVCDGEAVSASPAEISVRPLPPATA